MAREWPSDDELVKTVAQAGSKQQAAEWLKVPTTTLKDRVRKRRLGSRVDQALSEALRAKPPDAEEQPSGIRVDGNTIYVTTGAAEKLKLGEYEELLKDRGMDPSEWVVVSVKANNWNAMTSDKATGDNRVILMKQWTITLAPSPARLFLMPAVHVPSVKRTKVGPPASDKPELIVVEGDHQVPYHDPRLHEASLAMLKDLSKKHRLTEHVFLGDTGDYPSISRYDDHPSAMATAQEVVQETYTVLREKREAAPNVRARKLKGNHDWRIEGELLKRAERLYGLAPAQRWEDQAPEIPALHLNRLLHLPALGIELVEDPRGWQHAEVELVPGMGGLVVRHGWLTGAKTAAASVTKRGRSIIVGHIHRREMAYVWDPSAQCERVGCVAGTMSLCRDERFPHYATLDQWLAGCVIVTRWPDHTFEIEHARWNGDALRWRSESWR